ncbi:MAG TPA: hypothetical protein VFT13_10810 [Candidatus Krumholzibacteria bacterium]|nr:hypothetical protein [Candidatus Krumholzibacteria bacterium]
MVLEDALLIVVIPPLAGWVLWLLFKRHQLQTQTRLRRNETLNRLIDKFGTSKEFVDFLQTEAGRKFLEDPLAESVHPAARVHRFVLGGVILIALGGAFFVNALRYRGMTDINFINEAIGLNNWGTIFTSCGVALLVIALLSYLMARRWN